MVAAARRRQLSRRQAMMMPGQKPSTPADSAEKGAVSVNFKRQAADFRHAAHIAWCRCLELATRSVKEAGTGAAPAGGAASSCDAPDTLPGDGGGAATFMQLDLSFVDSHQERAFAAWRLQAFAAGQRRMCVMQVWAGVTFAAKQALAGHLAASLLGALVVATCGACHEITASHSVRCVAAP